MSGVIQSILEGKIDFEGQQLTDKAARIALVVITIVSFLLGFITQSLYVTFITFSCSTLALVLIVVPPWPLYNSHPVTWLPPQETEETKKKQ